MCLGYNTLHNIPNGKNDDPGNIEMHEDTPHGKRIWQWLILCEDRTVITIHEDPFPNRTALNSVESKSVAAIRRNLISCFKQCSAAGINPKEPALAQLPLRARMGVTNVEAAHRPKEVPGLLFYYLFDDWMNTYCLIARRNHAYAAELNRLARTPHPIKLEGCR
jgi:hypothetical protein